MDAPFTGFLQFKSKENTWEKIMSKTVYTLSNDLVATVAQLLQLAILTGTDLYEHLMTLQLVETDGKLSVSSEFQDKLNAEIQRLAQSAEEMSSEVGFELEQN